MALGVIAIAFIAMMGMLPVGMSVYRESKDSSNENWIFQVLQAKVLATDWKKLMPGANDSVSSSSPSTSVAVVDNVYHQEVYFYDEEGRFIWQEGGNSPFNSSDRAKAELASIYKAKIINGVMKRPEIGNGNTVTNVRQFAVILVNVNNKSAMTSFDTIRNVSDLGVKVHKGVRTRTFVVNKMDSTK